MITSNCWQQAQRFAEQREECLSLGHILLPFCTPASKPRLEEHLSAYSEPGHSGGDELPAGFKGDVRHADERQTLERTLKIIQSVRGPWRHFKQVLPELEFEGYEQHEHEHGHGPTSRVETLGHVASDVGFNVLEPIGASTEELWDRLRSLIGLKDVKAALNELAAYIEFQVQRKKQGLLAEQRIPNIVFRGNPGTGKTTIVHLLASILFRLDLLETGTVVLADRGSLVAEYVGQTAPKTKRTVEASRGGILFIDEAYNLVNSANGVQDTFGMECVSTLLLYLTQPDYCVIMAGYPEEMGRLLESNPGMKSRFSEHIWFPDYSEEELLEILELKVKLGDYTLSPAALQEVKRSIAKIVHSQSNHFGNGRSMENLLQFAIRRMAVRLRDSSPNRDELMRLEAADFALNDRQLTRLS